MDLNVGDAVTRIWGDGYLKSEVRVSAIDDDFVYCDAQRKLGEKEWFALPEDSEPWKFDRVYGVETDEEQGWGVEFDLLLTRIVLDG